MKKTLITLALISVITMCGCSDSFWESFGSGAQKTADIAATGESISGAVAPFTFGYGTAGVGILSGIGLVAQTLVSLAKSKRLAKAAVIAADLKPGGGKALNEAAALLNVGAEIVKAYKEGRG